ncbi:MAG: DUF488 domain-containing protein [Puniceicoccales bacterium]|jgi:uncharacterized protein YeaO (DUF488 family)|nr:DUF488 domain-containing protein [Puniceicoccales bacterium]
MIYTSYFAFLPKLPEHMLKISIALFTPQWAQVDACFPSLNPTEQLLREAKSGAIPPEEAMKKYQREILSKLSPIKIYKELIEVLNKSNKQHLALLCYEKPGEVCHRRVVAEWLEIGNAVSVPEYTVENDQLSLIL